MYNNVLQTKRYTRLQITTKMHHFMAEMLKKLKIFRGGACPTADTSPMGRGTPSPYRTSIGASVLHLLMLRHPTFYFFPTPMGEKDWKHVSAQKVVTLDIFAVTLVAWCLIFHLPRITTGSFQCHQCFEKCNIPIHSVRWKSCAFYKVVWCHFHVWWTRCNSLFSSEIT